MYEYSQQVRERFLLWQEFRLYASYNCKIESLGKSDLLRSDYIVRTFYRDSMRAQIFERVNIIVIGRHLGLKLKLKAL